MSQCIEFKQLDIYSFLFALVPLILKLSYKRTSMLATVARLFETVLKFGCGKKK